MGLLGPLERLLGAGSVMFASFLVRGTVGVLSNVHPTFFQMSGMLKKILALGQVP